MESPDDQELLRRRAGSLLLVGFDGTSVPEALRRFVAATPPAGVILFARNVVSTGAVGGLTRELRSLWPAGEATPLVAVDQEGGPVRRLRAPACPDVAPLPDARTIAASDDPDVTREAGEVLGRQLAALGFNLDLAPVLDVDSNPSNPIIGRRAFGTDPDAVSRQALAFAAGLQMAEVLPCGKHFPGHGDTDLDSHVALPRLRHGRERLERVELPPFRDAVEAGFPSIMTAHVVYEGLDATHPATLSPRVVPELLREALAFDGAVVSDDLDMAAIRDVYEADEVAAGLLEASVDIPIVARGLEPAVALRDALAARAAASSDDAARLARAAERARALRQQATDHAAAAQPVALPCADRARILIERLAREAASGG